MYNCVYDDGSTVMLDPDEYHTFGCPPEHTSGVFLVEADDLTQVGTGDPPGIVVYVPDPPAQVWPDDPNFVGPPIGPGDPRFVGPPVAPAPAATSPWLLAAGALVLGVLASGGQHARRRRKRGA